LCAAADLWPILAGVLWPALQGPLIVAGGIVALVLVAAR
jgi:hypothetical protein